MNPMYDLIGDIHGYADELLQLLAILGYRKHGTSHSHPERKVIFLGDFIDRGPKIREVLEIVRPMVEEGKALAVMGNHELNALAYHTEDPRNPGEFLRRRTEKNVHQHHKTLEQLSPAYLQTYLEWFRTLPMWLDLEGLRVIHACWDEQAIIKISHALQEYRGNTTAFLHIACKKGADLFDSVETALKGKEASLPDGLSFPDKDGNVRTEIRTRWYLPPEKHTYRTYALQSDAVACDVPLEESAIREAAPYPTTAKPVFIGHYWLSADRPEILAENVACLDYSVAKGGYLCGYRWHGEQKLKTENFVRT
jgi:hypothetical protein